MVHQLPIPEVNNHLLGFAIVENKIVVLAPLNKIIDFFLYSDSLLPVIQWHHSQT